MSAVEIAKSFINQWTAVFNACDDEARLQLIHFPHVRFMPSGQVHIADESMSRQLFAVGHQVQVDQRWDHSVLDEVEVIQSSKNMIHLTNRFTRYNAEGRAYLIGHALWILITVDGRWKRRCVSNINMQRLDVSAKAFQHEMANWEQRVQGE